MKNNLHGVLSKETAANAFGMDGKSVAENLVKINVYYTSLNEKIIQDEIVYSLQVSKKKSLNWF